MAKKEKKENTLILVTEEEHNKVKDRVTKLEGEVSRLLNMVGTLKQRLSQLKEVMPERFRR